VSEGTATEQPSNTTGIEPMKRFTMHLAVAALTLLSTAAMAATEWEADSACEETTEPACLDFAAGQRLVFFRNPGSSSMRVHAVGRKNGRETEKTESVDAPPGGKVLVGVLFRDKSDTFWVVAD